MLLAFSVAITALAFVYWFPIRRWMSRWGATPSDLTRRMAGDSLIVDPYTMAVAVHARPEHIWPWLVQMGYQRGGLCSYEWLDRLFGILDGPSRPGSSRISGTGRSGFESLPPSQPHLFVFLSKLSDLR
jgi:hypothetical protein